MTRSLRAALVLAATLLANVPVHAQDPAPAPLPLHEPIGPYVIDARGVLARFKQNPTIAAVLGVEATDLPTRGLGLTVGAHVYPVRKRNFALGVGGELLLRARASHTITTEIEGPDGPIEGPEGPTVITRMTAISPQVSLNFGRRNGWSYVSGGLGRASFTSELEASPFDDPESAGSALNYGGGARWFTNKHLAVSIDLRFYAVRAQDATAARPAFPAMTLMVFSAGVSFR